MDFEKKYLKYKKKYADLQFYYNDLINQKGGDLQKMPQLCLGSVHWDLENPDKFKNILIRAIELGYRHFDGATNYSQVDGYTRQAPNRDIYLKMFGEGILEGLAKVGIERKDVWVTFKGMNVNNVAEEIEKSKLGYFDLWMFHHGMGASESLVPFLESGMIRNWGVSNGTCPDNIISGKKCFAEQVNLRFDNLQKEIPVMLYSPFKLINDKLNSLIETNFELFLVLFEKWPKLSKKYLKYILKNNVLINDKNVLMIGSSSGNSIENTIGLFNNISTNPLTSEEEIEVQSFLRDLNILQ